jgi:DNA-binding SARP family transcriptional activator
MLLDNQTLDRLDDCAARLMPPPRGATPLALFVDAARLLLAAQRHEPAVSVGDALERVFTALGSSLEPELRLRASASALHLLGMELDRVRGDDFLAAGAALAASPAIGAYSRALWHLFVAESLYVDAASAPLFAREIDGAIGAAAAAGAPVLQARAHLLRAAVELGAGDLVAGCTSLAAAHPLLDPRYPCDYTLYHWFRSRHALQGGEAEAALAHINLATVKAAEGHSNDAGLTPVIMQAGFVHAALGQFGSAAASFARAAVLSSGAQAVPCLCHVHLVQALAHVQRGAHNEARAELSAGFELARRQDLTHFFRALPRVAAQVCSAALELDADARYAAQVVALRGLTCPDAGAVSWPWPVRIRLLGTFAVERDGEPVRFGRKAPKRLLDVLRLVAALGGRQVDVARVAAMLWPDAEGGGDRDSLKAMLHRARALFGCDVIVVRDGLMSFDDECAWLDTWAFEHVVGRIEALDAPGATVHADGELELRRLQLLRLYRGHFLGETEVPAWALPLRDRLRARFIRCVDMLGQRLERCGRPDDAVALYRSALEQDNLAEELYQRLIACHIARGEHAQALNAYRRCRELLSIVLGLRPSARTEALAARIAGR